MPNIVTHELDDSKRALALLLFTEQFATLVESGINLSSALDALMAEAPAPYASAARELRHQVVENSTTLTRAVAAQPEYFSPIFCTMVRVGEVGGTLDRVFRFLADLLREEWKFACLIARHQGDVVRLNSLQIAARDRLADLNGLECTLVLLLFCRSFGMMLTSGVPVMQAIETAAGLLPGAERDIWLTGREQTRHGGTLAIDFLPCVARTIITEGETKGKLDQAIDKVADYFARELECRLWLAVSGSPQPEGFSMPCGVAHQESTPYSEPVIRMANIIIVNAIREQTSEIIVTFDMSEGKETPDLLVRYVTGSGMSDVMTLPVFVHKPLVDRLKLMAEMDLETDRENQEGRMTVVVENRAYDIRVSSILSAFGEGLILRFTR